MYLGDIARRNAFRYPAQTAIEAGSACLTWSELNDRVNRLAFSLNELGLRKRDRIAVLAAPSAEVAEQGSVPVTAEPTRDELRMLREEIDTSGVLQRLIRQ